MNWYKDICLSLIILICLGPCFAVLRGVKCMCCGLGMVPPKSVSHWDSPKGHCHILTLLYPPLSHCSGTELRLGGTIGEGLG